MADDKSLPLPPHAEKQEDTISKQKTLQPNNLDIATSLKEPM